MNRKTNFLIALNILFCLLVPQQVIHSLFSS